jgi:hypothetical protein
VKTKGEIEESNDIPLFPFFSKTTSLNWIFPPSAIRRGELIASLSSDRTNEHDKREKEEEEDNE